MDYANFKTLAEAKAHRYNHGGWLFVPTDETAGVFWFCLDYTTTPVLNHRAIRGLSGQLA